MKKIIAAALAVLSMNAFAANWHQASSSADQTVRVYIDVDSIKKNKDKAYAWVMLDMNEPKAVPNYAKQPGSFEQTTYKSYAAKHVYVCSERKSAATLLMFYSGNTGGGDQVGKVQVTEKANPPAEVVPGTLEDALLTMACKGKVS